MNESLFGYAKTIAAAIGLALLASAVPVRAAGDEAAQLEALRAASERFKDVNVALKEGYIKDPSGMCMTAEMEGQPAELGEMGVHYFRPDRLGITGVTPRVSGTGTHTDFADPGVLVYEPQADGSMVLVAVENLVFDKGWKAAGNTAPPSFEGHPYKLMVDDPSTPADEAHGFEPHLELHAWLYRDNPNGRFEPFNPNVTCEHNAAHAHNKH
jgi:hypothetical protein